jgi:hypothetical protein
MNSTERHHPPAHHPEKHPYWKRIHRDWKAWVVVLLMLTAMWVYLRTNDLSVQPAAQRQQHVP